MDVAALARQSNAFDIASFSFSTDWLIYNDSSKLFSQLISFDSLFFGTSIRVLVLLLMFVNESLSSKLFVFLSIS